MLSIRGAVAGGGRDASLSDRKRSSTHPLIYTNIPTLLYLISEITILPTFYEIGKSFFKKFFWETLGFLISFSYIILLKIKLK